MREHIAFSSNAIHIFKIYTHIKISIPVIKTLTSISSALNIPRETVKRKIDHLIKEKYLSLNSNKSITLGANYQKIFQAFALETTYDLGKVMSRWNRKGYIEKLMSLIK